MIRRWKGEDLLSLRSLADFVVGISLGDRSEGGTFGGDWYQNGDYADFSW